MGIQSIILGKKDAALVYRHSDEEGEQTLDLFIPDDSEQIPLGAEYLSGCYLAAFLDEELTNQLIDVAYEDTADGNI